MTEIIMNLRSLLISNLSNLLLMTIVWYYILFRAVWKREQKNLWYDNFEWWAYRWLIDMFKNQWYPYPEAEANKTLDSIIKTYKTHLYKLPEEIKNNMSYDNKPENTIFDEFTNQNLTLPKE